jgi:tRNA nucleotidyltransferase (CCA-adding enzyme)
VDIYLVGGAVRDALLGLPPGERDWVVVGSSPEEMLRLGYRQVGRDFPVFLHPQTNDEYALARTERKVAPGHTGFVCHAGPDVTLEQDLQRRDLTVNAMAQTAAGALVDPWGGAADLRSRRLRHVSPAFVEDPLRVFRVARFAAKLGAFGFRVDADTQRVMQDMCRQDLLAELAPERVWQELAKALSTDRPGVFFTVLDQCGGLDRWFAEITAVDVADVAELLDTRIAPTRPDSVDRFGALGSLLDARSVETLADRLKAPNDFRRCALDVAQRGRTLLDWRTTDSTLLLDAAKSIGAIRQPMWFERIVEDVSASASVDLSALLQIGKEIATVASATFRARGLEGAELGSAMDAARIAIIRKHQGE